MAKISKFVAQLLNYYKKYTRFITLELEFKIYISLSNCFAIRNVAIYSIFFKSARIMKSAF